MSQFATGVTVLTVGGDHIHAMTANAFSSVSLTPPTVLVSIDHSAVMFDEMTGGGHFGVNILAARQEPLARHFADKKRTLGRAQFDDVEWTPGEHTGAPLLAGALAWLECDVIDAHVSGDHTIFVGRVLDCRRGSDDPALTFFDGTFGRAPRAA
ncbi:flavin reductase family protein [Streptomyces luteolifulvus]|uniref:Flavin reductase family protein n=2 Tax=Streptomyces TaxID=1883 RepID=A0A6H9UZL6_9ACTN|nr:flavin reductase family protein [Streptomyces luteolifulvus]MXM65853.1 flavin reductase [Streptomyces sp. HUCO-GS316]